MIDILCKDIVKQLKINRIVETGTDEGDTVAEVSQWFSQNEKHQIHSVDLDEGSYQAAKERFKSNGNIYLHHASSERFLNSLLTVEAGDKSSANNYLFFLDAHWGNYWPLRDELNVIRQLNKYLIVIDDFMVPGKSNPSFPHGPFGFDVYKGQILNWAYIHDIFAAHPVRIFYPKRPNRSQRGWILIVHGYSESELGFLELFELFEFGQWDGKHTAPIKATWLTLMDGINILKELVPISFLRRTRRIMPLQWPKQRVRNSYFNVQLRLFFRALGKRKISFRKIFNVFLNDLTFLFKTKKGPPAPYIVAFELWNECNAGCLFCRDKKGKIHDLNPRGSGFIPKGKMPPDMAKDIIRQLKEDLLIAVLYTNGEPLLYKELPQVIQYATDCRVASMIATNGLLFNEGNARAILEAGIDFIKIQLSGFTQDIYGIQIRHGDVEGLKTNIRMLAGMNRQGGYGSIILIDYILYNYNRHQLKLVKEFCQELGLLLNVRPGNPKGGLEDQEPALATPLELPLKISCDYLWKVMQVNFNGDILPCCEAVVWSNAKPYETFKIGQTDIREVWQGKAAQAMRAGMKDKGRAGLDMCAQCTRQGVCFKW